MSEFIKNATDLIEHGHVRVGAEVVKDPAFLVSRTLEDFVTWVDSSAIRKHVMEYNNIVSQWICIWLVNIKDTRFANSEYVDNTDWLNFYLCFSVMITICYEWSGPYEKRLQSTKPYWITEYKYISFCNFIDDLQAKQIEINIIIYP